jgi:hypothetical protein
MTSKISLFASAIRPHLWQSLFDSLKGTTEDVEIVFAGNVEKVLAFNLPDKVSFRYILTKNIKPAQIYEVARRECKGELISWTADDAEFPNDFLGKAYRFFKSRCEYKDIMSTQTRENYGTWQMCDISCHKFFAASGKAPKMCPMGIMNREYLNFLGGIDRRYVCGQWDNDIVMRAYGQGSKVIHFDEAYIELDHLGKHDKRWGVSGDRPFGKAYYFDRKILEGSWGERGQMNYNEFPNFTRYDTGFEPFEDVDLKTKSQSNNIPNLWND